MSKSTTQTRWNLIASSIRAAVESGELLPQTRLPSETAMAAQWGVSPMTVHRAMQELQREGVVLRRRGAGTVVAERKISALRRVGLVFTSLVDSPQSTYVRGIQQSLGDKFQVLTFDAHENIRRETTLLEHIAEEADALICYPSCAAENTPLLKEIISQMPVVLVDRHPKDVVADTIMTDNKTSVMSGLEFLASRGHQHIACFMEDVSYISSVAERLEGYSEFMQKHNAANASRWVYQIPRALSHAAYCAYAEEQVVKMLSDSIAVTAVFCQHDRLTAAVLEAFVYHGIAVPDQIEIVGINDIDPNLVPLSRSIHRLVQRTSELGSMAARRLEIRMENPELPPQIVKLQTDLMPATARDRRSLATA
jgi:GntR family transcriptional regulator of arabinose operon